MKNAKMVDQEEFKEFAKSMKAVIDQYEKSADTSGQQELQVIELLSLEKQFRDALNADPDGVKVWATFIHSIVYERGNILTARPYFRERQGRFSQYISPALKNEDPAEISKYNINYQFIAFVMKNVDERLRGVLLPLEKKVKFLRNKMVEMNMPLAINRARVFYSRTPRSHLTYMDLVMIAAAGMLHGIDKYAPDETGIVNPKQFRSTVIGVMGGCFLNDYNQTLLHFFPQDKRKLYRAHKVVGRQGPLMDFQEIADLVNIDPVDMVGKDFIKNPTNADEIAEILAAASTVSADSLNDKHDSNFDIRPEPITRFAAPDSCRPDIKMQVKNDTGIMFQAINALSIWEQKILRLKGVRPDCV